MPYGKPVIPVLSELKLEGVETAKQIHYWGHYPVADMEFETDAPIQVGLRAWSPFLPGDLKTSMMPAAVFEVHLRNPGNTPQTGTIAFSFPGPDPKEAGTKQLFSRRYAGIDLDFDISDGRARSRSMRALCGTRPKWTVPWLRTQSPWVETIRKTLGPVANSAPTGPAWAKIATALPIRMTHQPGASIAVDFSLPARGEKTWRFILAWSAPTWNGIGYNWGTAVPKRYKGSARTFTHMYAKDYPSPEKTIGLIAQEPRLAVASRSRLAASRLHRRLATRLAPRVVDQFLYMITEDSLWCRPNRRFHRGQRKRTGCLRCSNARGSARTSSASPARSTAIFR